MGFSDVTSATSRRCPARYIEEASGGWATSWDCSQEVPAQRHDRVRPIGLAADFLGLLPGSPRTAGQGQELALQGLPVHLPAPPSGQPPASGCPSGSWCPVRPPPRSIIAVGSWAGAGSHQRWRVVRRPLRARRGGRDGPARASDRRRRRPRRPRPIMLRRRLGRLRRPLPPGAGPEHSSRLRRRLRGTHHASRLVRRRARGPLDSTGDRLSRIVFSHAAFEVARGPPGSRPPHSLSQSDKPFRSVSPVVLADRRRTGRRGLRGLR